jgi:hypothetical protein
VLGGLWNLAGSSVKALVMWMRIRVGIKWREALTRKVHGHYFDAVRARKRPAVPPPIVCLWRSCGSWWPRERSSWWFWAGQLVYYRQLNLPAGEGVADPEERLARDIERAGDELGDLIYGPARGPRRLRDLLLSRSKSCFV